ncbi:MAG: hypothetical protein JNK11_21310, partial [Alphaproteobacteria bacterium]|nr:hypothetical protein [Alphaproteobacteria bacterium]
ERKLGTPDAELASPVPFSLKVCIATVLENTFRLFGLPNPYLTMCATYASRAGEGERDGITELAKLCKRRLNAGNGSQSHRFLRIAASAIALQCPTAEGISFVRMRVDRSIAQHGTLSNEKFNLDGLPQWEEEYENPDAWFRDVTLTLEADGASVCAFGILALAGFLKVAGKHEVGERLRLTFITSMKGHCGFNDGFRPADRIRDLQNRLVQASELLRSGGEPAALLGGIADTFAAFKDKEASAFVSDRTVKPVEGPLPWVDDALATLAEAKAAVIDNMSKTATPTLTGKGSTIGGRGTVDPTQAAAVDRAFEQGMRLLKVHGFAAIASAQQG